MAVTRHRPDPQITPRWRCRQTPRSHGQNGALVRLREWVPSCYCCERTVPRSTGKRQLSRFVPVRLSAIATARPGTANWCEPSWLVRLSSNAVWSGNGMDR